MVTELPSNYKMTESLGQFTTEQGVVGIEGVDTRAITRHVRDFGVDERHDLHRASGAHR